MKLRIARHTDRLSDLVGFYRNRVGFPEIDRFDDHAGYDGVCLQIPGTGTQLELTTGGNHGVPEPQPESLLVLYFATQAALDEVAARIDQPPVVPANPYWRTNAVTYADPDGFLLLLTLRD